MIYYTHKLSLQCPSNVSGQEPNDAVPEVSPLLMLPFPINITLVKGKL